MKDNQHAQLFTELTPEEGAVVEGGARLRVRFIFANNPPEDDPIVQVGRSTVVFKEKDFRNGNRIINKFVPFQGDTTLSIWDDDHVADGEDLLAYRRISSSTTNNVQYLKGGGYTVSYTVHK